MEAPSRPIDPFVWWVAAAAVVLAGVALLGMAPGPYRPLEHQAFLAPLFAAGGALLARFPLHLTAKTKVYVDTAVITAAAILFDVPWAAAIGATSVAINEVILRDSWEQAIFNTAQAALYVGVGSAAYHMLAGASFPTVLPGIGNPVAVVACAASMYVVNTLLIATIGARQVGANPWQTWRDSVWLGMPEHAVLVVAAVAFAAVGRDAPWILPILAVPSAMAYVSLRRGARAQDSAHEALNTLAMVGELRQARRVGHAERVAAHARAMANDLGLPPQEIDDVATAARLHELGKVLIELGPNGASDGNLVPDRGAASYAVSGADFVARLSTFATAARCIRHHHERWDGSGQPAGLAGESIPLGARIVGVADAYDELAMSAASFDEIEVPLRQLQTGAGTAWDPRVVEALTRELGDRPRLATNQAA